MTSLQRPSNASTTQLPKPIKALTVASNVVYGHVGNTLTTPVLQALSWSPSALPTCYFSTHTAYGPPVGRRVPAEEVAELYEGLKRSRVAGFQVIITGYIPSGEVVTTVGRIVRDVKLHSATAKERVFWVLDPVMGDRGKLYVDESVVAGYKKLAREADMIIPNGFEAELLSDIPVKDDNSAIEAITVLHKQYQLAHVVISSVDNESDDTLSIYASSATSDGKPRIVRLKVPNLPAFFSGAGDLLTALATFRLREAAGEAGVLGQKSWVSPDDVQPKDLPLASAILKAVQSLQGVLERTLNHITVTEEEVDAETEERERHKAERNAEREEERRSSEASQKEDDKKDDEEVAEEDDPDAKDSRNELPPSKDKFKASKEDDPLTHRPEITREESDALLHQDHLHLHLLRTAQSELAIIESYDLIRDPSLTDLNIELVELSTTKEEEDMPIRPHGEAEKKGSVEEGERAEEAEVEKDSGLVAEDEDDKREEEKQTD